MQQPMIPPPAPVRIEEILQLFLLVSLTIYLVCHIMLIPIEVLVIALCHDPALVKELTILYSIYGAKYVATFVMLYCAYHHTNLWKNNSHFVLWFLSAFCLIVTGVFSWGVIVANEFFVKHNFKPVYDHPIFFDFIGFDVCGVQGVIYLAYLAATHPGPSSAYEGYQMVPNMVFMGPHAMREMQTVSQLEAPKVEVPKPVQPEAPKPVQPEAPKTKAHATNQPIPIYFVPAY